MASQSSFYSTDGSTRTYPSTKHIATKQHVAVWRKRVVDSIYEIVPVTGYQLVNNSVVFDVTQDQAIYSEIEVRVADAVDELTANPSEVGIVASNIDDIIIVATDIAAVVNVSNNMGAVSTVSGNTANINSVAYNMAELLTVNDNATIATTQAGIATAMANTATSIYDQFDDRYLGSKALAPTLDNDGNALLIGALYFDTTQNLMKVYGSSGWVSAGSSVNGTTERHTYTATAGQTSFNANYESGYVDVFLNGSKLQSGVDFTATSGTAIVLTASANVGDIIDIIAYGVFEVANTTPKGNEAYTVSTIADLASVPSSYTTAIVKDLDRGGTFIWSSTGTANDGTVFTGATGYWTRQYSGAVNVKWFGAKGDGVTDDTTISNLVFSLYKDVYYPIGNYLISGVVYYYSSGSHFSGQGFHRNAIDVKLRDIVNPIGIVPSFHQLQIGNGDNSTFRGVSGGYIKSKDRDGITASERGVLYGLQLSVEPNFDRNNFPYDDAVGLVISNEGTGRGTEAIYFGNNPAIPKDFGALCGFDADALVGIYYTGSYNYGIDCLWSGTPSTFANGFLRVPNAVASIVSRNAANTADITVLRVNNNNYLEIMSHSFIPEVAYTPTVTADAGAFGGVTIASADYGKVGKQVFVNIVFRIDTVGTATGSIKITMPISPSKSYILNAVNISSNSVLTAVGTSGSTLRISNATGGTPIVAGNFYQVSGTYFVA